MDDQERALLEGYRRLRPESKRIIMSTLITAVTKEPVAEGQNGLPPEANPVQAATQFSDRETR